jgi:mitogen-activated protein kinase binding protein 1
MVRQLSSLSYNNIFKFNYHNFLVTSQLCTSLINQLVMTTNNVLQLHQRLQSSEEPTSTGNNNFMLKELENAVVMTQNMLKKITAR